MEKTKKIREAGLALEIIGRWLAVCGSMGFLWWAINKLGLGMEYKRVIGMAIGVLFILLGVFVVPKLKGRLRSILDLSANESAEGGNKNAANK